MVKHRFPKKYPRHVVLPNGCWKWQLSLDTNGYGRDYYGKEKPKRRIGAHVAYYLESGRSIPEGKELDHLCRNRWCVNPEHLEPVTRKENVNRGLKGKRTHCFKGHLFTEESTYYFVSNDRKKPRKLRRCKICSIANAKKRNKKKRLEGNEETK